MGLSAEKTQPCSPGARDEGHRLGREGGVAGREQWKAWDSTCDGSLSACQGPLSTQWLSWGQGSHSPRWLASPPVFPPGG